MERVEEEGTLGMLPLKRILTNESNLKKAAEFMKETAQFRAHTTVDYER